MKSKPKINIEIEGKVYSYKLFESLDLIAKTYSQRKTANKLKISHTVLNRRIKKSENELGFKLVKSSESGSELTKKGLELIKTYNKYENRLKTSNELMIYGGPITLGLLEYLSNGVSFDISLYSSDDLSSYKLAEKDLVDILALDDPLIAFKNDLDFIPIAYDHLVLVSNNETNDASIKNLKDLKDLKFVSANGTAQRLAWQTLKDNRVKFNIVKEVKSQYDAFKIVKNSDSLYTFLNGSFFKGSEILKSQTKHVISIVPFNTNKPETKEFIDYILDKGQKKIINQGFTPIKPWKI
jgi:molybdenum-dependent DNA-binding transcriptional regulator ModE